MRCPVPTYACAVRFAVLVTITLRARYAVSGTDLESTGVFGLRACYAMPGTELRYAATRAPVPLPSDSERRLVQHTTCPIDLPPLRMSGTHTGVLSLPCYYAMSGTAIARAVRKLAMLLRVLERVAPDPARYLPTPALCDVRYWLGVCPTRCAVLASHVRYWRSVCKACYAMRGTKLAHGGTSCYAVCGTEIAYGATGSYAVC
eukprot:2201913-Rhodomonas_salina.1